MSARPDQHSLQLPGRPPVPRDRDGYLKQLADWDRQVAEALAAEAGITLTEAHWQIILLLREFHQRHQLSPATRALVRFVAQELGKDKGNSIYLMQLFPGNPALLGSKIAGLPRPRNCF